MLTMSAFTITCTAMAPTYYIFNRWNAWWIRGLGFILSFFIGWLGGGILSLSLFVTDNYSDAAFDVFTAGLWFSLAGAAWGAWQGHKKQSAKIVTKE